MENRWAKAASEGKTIEVDIKVIYEGDSKRPSRFLVTEKIDGVVKTTPFQNQAGG
ncbi:DNA/RNA non-specific endonuclease [Marinobacterium iners DSM 11526]|uniref:DNA/RNA non-specific endonuclease n=2 Tax=Marinobacterium iners TaxID=48076 RepID=A0A1H4HA78_9GAMM|nr:DNA/RNA non-specific endonuclease [Marinobacterium iners DSM 11526]